MIENSSYEFFFNFLQKSCFSICFLFKTLEKYHIYIYTHTVAEDCQGLQPRQENFFPNLFLEILTPFRIIFFNLVSLDFFSLYIYIS
jgi:hypothetical protein